MTGKGEMQPIARAKEVFCTVSIESSAEASPPPIAAATATPDTLNTIRRIASLSRA